MKSTVFHGWWMVTGCLLIATVAWSFALYGPSVYLHTISQLHGWSLSLISSALTLSFLVNAMALGLVGGVIGNIGPKPVMATGAAVMATGLACMGQSSEVWQVYVSFALMGLGWSCLSTTAISSTLAPWFDRHQGRAMSTALLGASVGGMIGVPILLYLISWIGFAATMLVVALIVIGTVWPICLLVLQHRPQDMGLHVDGEPQQRARSATTMRRWTRGEALQTRTLRTVMLAFGMALMVQIGFLTHQVSLLLPTLGESGTALCVTLAAVLAFTGRLLLAKFSDQVDVRVTACGVLLVSGLGLTIVTLSSAPWALVTGVLIYGLTAGNITTLPPIIVRREFGALSFGAVFGVAAMLIQFLSAMGPAFFGVLHDLGGGYQIAMAFASLLNFIAAGVILTGRRDTAPAAS